MGNICSLCKDDDPIKKNINLESEDNSEILKSNQNLLQKSQIEQLPSTGNEKQINQQNSYRINIKESINKMKYPMLVNSTTIKTRNSNSIAVKSKSFVSKKVSSITINSSYEKEIISSLKKVYLFKEMNEFELNELIYFMYIVKCSNGQEIISKTNPIMFFFIVMKGSFLVINNEEKENEENENENILYFSNQNQANINSESSKENIVFLKKGSSFGESSLIQTYKFNGKIVSHEDNSEIFALNKKDYQEFLKGLNKSRQNLKIEYIKKIDILSNLSYQELVMISSEIKEVKYKKSTVIHSSNEKLNGLYIIKEGSVMYKSTKGELIKQLEKDSYFGEYDIITKKEIEYEIISGSDSILYLITISLLESCLGSQYEQILLYSIYDKAINNSTFFKNLILESDLESIFHLFRIYKYSRNEVIYNKNLNFKLKIIIVLQGNLVEAKTMKVLSTKGSIFGDFLLTNLLYDNEIIAFPYCICMETQWDSIVKEIIARNKIKKIDPSNEFKKSLTGISNKTYSYTEMGYANLYKQINILKNVPLFNGAEEKNLIRILNLLVKEVFLFGDEIIVEDTDADKFYIIIKGKVNFYSKGVYIRTFEEGNFFGELSFLNNKKRSVTAKASSKEVVCYSLNKTSFDEEIHGEIKEKIKERMNLINDQIEFEDLNYIKPLGKGRFGDVSLVKYNSYKYAIKRVSQNEIWKEKEREKDKEENIIKYILNEKNLLVNIDHAFIVKLIKSYSDSKNFFLLMEYIDGKTLNSYLYNKNKNENSSISTTIIDIQYIVSSLLVTIQYLNKKNIIHRDVKPDNILIDNKGYVKLIDFGIAKEIKNYTDTIVGTSYFMAPEVIEGKGYSFSVDYWSIGICLYLMIYKKFPFEMKNNTLELYKLILNLNIQSKLLGSNKSFKDSITISMNDVNRLLSVLLEREYSKRVSFLRTVKNHSFFSNLSFEGLVNLSINIKSYIKNIYSENLSIDNETQSFSEVKYKDFLNKNSFKKQNTIKRRGNPNVKGNFNLLDEYY